MLERTKESQKKEIEKIRGSSSVVRSDSALGSSCGLPRFTLNTSNLMK